MEENENILKKLKKVTLIYVVMEIFIFGINFVFYPLNGYSSSLINTRNRIFIFMQILYYVVIKVLSKNIELKRKYIYLFEIASIIILLLLLFLNAKHVFLENHINF